MANLLLCLEQEDFDVGCFVQRVVCQALGGEDSASGENPQLLKNAFEKTIIDLVDKYEIEDARAELLQKECHRAENTFHEQVKGILIQQKEALVNYKQARRQTNHIVAKTTYLGDMLEAHHVPRSRLMDTSSLIEQFENVLSSGLRKQTNDGENGVNAEYAENILKLHLAASELLSNRYDEAKQKIAKEYSEVEASLLAEMSTAQRKGDIVRLREIVTLMSNFCGYTACVDQFIVNAQKKAFTHPDVFLDLVRLCEKVSRVVQQVFPYPEIVTGKFVDRVLRGRVNDYLKAQLTQEETTLVTAKQVYLTRIAQLFSKATNVCNELRDIPMDSATRNSLRKIPQELFAPYLRNYAALEHHCMKVRLDTLISAYYQSVGHQRKITATSPIRAKCSVIRRDFQSKINSKAATLINLAPSVKDFGGETYICEALAVTTLQELREAFQRATTILPEPTRNRLVVNLWQIFLSKFVENHLLYGIDLGVKTIPVCQDLTVEPKQDFLRSVYHANAIFYLIEDLFSEKVLPSLTSSIAKQKARQCKIRYQTPLENSIRVGLKRSVKAYANWLGIILSKQKIAEFLYSSHTSPTALKVVQYCKKCLKSFDDYLDGRNREIVSLEFGRRFHKAILQNIRRFHYSQESGMGLLCDVMEYRSVMAATELPVLNEIFKILHTLCTLLVESPEKLVNIIEQELSNRLETQIIKEFVQLRQDCKSNKLLAVLFHDTSP